MDIDAALQALDRMSSSSPTGPIASPSERMRQAIDARRVIGPFPGHLFTWHGVRTREGLRFLQGVRASVRHFST